MHERCCHQNVKGGGSHAAFAAGVLSELLSPSYVDRFELVGLSGTSGGAICAALAWAGLIRGGPEEARKRLLGMWRDLEVHNLFDEMTNFWLVSLARSPITEEISPYAYYPVAAKALKTLLERHLHLEKLPAAPERRSHPSLLVGACDILAGQRTIFKGEDLTYDMVLASAAIPPLYRAVEIGGRVYWDGLYATNPPIRELTDLPQNPEEIWIVQINPMQRSREPRTMREIADRRNELAGNLSLGQELYFIQKINDLLGKHPAIGDHYKEIKIRVVELSGDGLETLDYPSKFDRGQALIEKLLANGAKRAGCFFNDDYLWPRANSIPARSLVYGA